MKSEKRKHVRFFAKGDIYVALGTNFNKIGKLKDISIGGLAFTYIDETDDCVQDSSKVTIFISETGLYLPHLSSKLIYHSSQLSTNNTQFFKTIFRTFKCGLQFTTIDEYQLDKIKFFINILINLVS